MESALPILVTSFSPTRIDAQHKALSSWRKYDCPIIAVQCHGEIYSKDFKPDKIIWVDPNTNWSKPTPSLTSMPFDETFLYVNSDIELTAPDLSWWSPEPNTIKIGLRTDYCPQFTQINKYGIDVFCLTPDMKKYLTNSIWALGMPGWDYWVTLALLKAKYKLLINKSGILHAAHHEQWNQVDYKQACLLLEYEFDMTFSNLSSILQNITSRTNLTKKILN